MALEKAAAHEKAVVRENEHRLAAMAASDSQGPAKKQKTLDNAFNKEHYDMAHKMWARAFVSAGIPFTCVEDSNLQTPVQTMAGSPRQERRVRRAATTKAQTHVGC